MKNILNIFISVIFLSTVNVYANEIIDTNMHQMLFQQALSTKGIAPINLSLTIANKNTITEMNNSKMGTSIPATNPGQTNTTTLYEVRFQSGLTATTCYGAVLGAERKVIIGECRINLGTDSQLEMKY